MNLRGTASLAAIAAVLVFGVGYMGVGVLHLDPRRHYLTADMLLDNSGGLGPNSPVLLDGVQVGQATEVTERPDGALVRLRIDTRYSVPIASDIRVEQLSALGEPYIEFAPDSGDGPYLRDGQTIPTDRVHMPVTITELSTRAVQLLDQLHPQAVADLVDTFTRALSGTDAAMQTLQRSTDLLAATLLSRTDVIRRLFADIQALGGNIDWLGPSLATAGPQFGGFGSGLNSIVVSASSLVDARPLTQYTSGGGLVPFLGNLTEFLNKIGPGLAPLAPVLAPVVANSVARTTPIDVGALIDEALHSVDPDGTLHFRITAK